jgi:hypothetical protein
MIDYLLPNQAKLRVGSTGPVVVDGGSIVGSSTVTLRPMQVTDPPMVLAFGPATLPTKPVVRSAAAGHRVAT